MGHKHLFDACRGVPAFHETCSGEALAAGVVCSTCSCDCHRPTLEACICGEHKDCPDGWHSDEEMPCSCTPDCVLDAVDVLGDSTVTEADDA